MDTQRTSSCFPSQLVHAAFLLLFFYSSQPVLAVQADVIEFYKLSLSSGSIQIGETLTLEGELRNVADHVITIEFLSFYVSEPVFEVAKVGPIRTTKDITVVPSELIPLRFDLKPKKAGDYSLGFIVYVKDGPVIRSPSVKVSVSGEAFIYPLTLIVVIFSLAAGTLSVLRFRSDLKRHARNFLSDWKERPILTLTVLFYVAIQFFAPYITRPMPRELARVVLGFFDGYINTVGWLLTPIALLLYGYISSKAVKSFLIALLPPLIYGIYSEVELVQLRLTPAVSIGFILLEGYIGTSLGILAASTAILHIKRRLGLALFSTGWIMWLILVFSVLPRSFIYSLG